MREGKPIGAASTVRVVDTNRPHGLTLLSQGLRRTAARAAHSSNDQVDLRAWPASGA